MDEHMNTPRKNTSRFRDPQTRARVVIIVAAALVAAGLTAPALNNAPAPAVSGAVDSGWGVESFCGAPGYSQLDGGTCWQRPSYHLIVKTADGQDPRVEVTEQEFWACSIHDRYPACARKAGGK